MSKKHEFLVGEDGLDIMETEHDSDLTEMDRHELAELIKKATDELMTRSFVVGFKTGVDNADWYDNEENFPYEDNVDPPTEGDLMRMGGEVESPQERRDSIVERAKGDLTLLIPDDRIFEGKYYGVDGGWICDVDFVVNKEKRTVVALMRGHASGDIYSKGIAKCATTDCFNVHIGKAIALRRALGEDVPDEYLNAPQPSEVRVGDIVKTRSNRVRKVSRIDDIHMHYNNGFCNTIDTIRRGYIKIIDDSREGVSE